MIALNSANPADAPRIDPNYLAEEQDRIVLREGLKVLREVFSQRAFEPYRGLEITPGKDIQTDAQLDAHVRSHAESIYHPVGSCKMGNDEGAVVDAELRVHGLKGLRVVDASVMPTLVGGNTNAPTIMLAEKASDLILGRKAPEAELVFIAEDRVSSEPEVDVIPTLTAAADLAAEPEQAKTLKPVKSRNGKAPKAKKKGKQKKKVVA